MNSLCKLQINVFELWSKNSLFRCWWHVKGPYSNDVLLPGIHFKMKSEDIKGTGASLFLAISINFTVPWRMCANAIAGLFSYIKLLDNDVVLTL